jgi:hypothetical protein
MIENKIPDDYKWQIVNYFLINEDLETLDLCLYNPDMYLEKLRIHIIKVKREDLQDEIDKIMKALDPFVESWKNRLNEVKLKLNN